MGIFRHLPDRLISIPGPDGEEEIGWVELSSNVDLGELSSHQRRVLIAFCDQVDAFEQAIRQCVPPAAKPPESAPSTEGEK